MVRWTAVLLLLILPSAEGVSLLEDDAGDVQAWTLATAPQPAPGRDAMDLIGLEATETADSIVFRLQVADLTGPAEAPLADDHRYIIAFTHHDQTYMAILYRAIGDQNYYWGFLVKADDALTQFTFVRPFWNDEVRPDEAAGVIEVEVARSDIVDSDGAEPFPGRALDSFWAFTSSRTTEGFIQLGQVTVGPQWGTFDRMPDTANGTTPLDIAIGLEQTGDGFLFSPSPFRASNGEATTFVFNMTARHAGAEPALYDIVLSNVPNAWTVTLPFDTVQIPADGEVAFPVLVTTPFAHNHGAVESMLVETRSESGTGRAEIGIRYHEVPQPAGHHDTLYFHSQRFGEDNPLFVITDNLFSGNSGLSYLNTLENDDNDQQVAINGLYAGWGCHDPCVPSAPVSRWQWFSFLQPGLEMGLDFDLTQTGTLEATFQADQPLPQSYLDGQLVYWRFAPWTETWTRMEIAQLEATALSDLSGAFQVEWEITMDPSADRLPYIKNSFFGVEMNLTSLAPHGFTGAEAPMLTGGRMQLPLLEYHDPVTDIFATTHDVMWMSDIQEVGVNPGETAVFNTTLHNTGDTDTYRLDLVGANADWASLHGPETVTLAKDGRQGVQIAVLPPASALAGERIDLILSAISVDDPTQRALIRLVAIVETDVDHPDQAAMLSPTVAEKESPLPLLVSVVALVGIAFRRRP